MKTWKRALALVLALVMALSLVALPSFAEGEEESAGDTGMPYIKDHGGTVTKDGLVMSKTIKEGENGQFLLTLEAYATGQTATTVSELPLDIVLVLDVSGSMGKPMTKVYADQLDKSKSYKVGPFSNWSGTYYKTVSYFNGKWKTSRYGDSYTPKTSESDSNSNHYQFYETETRLEALQAAVNNFAESVSTKAKGADGRYGTNDDVEHRIAVVSFADTAAQKTNGLVKMNTSQGLSTVKNAVSSLNAEGNTDPAEGLNMANSIFSSNPTDGQQRSRVVLLFTDGYPAGDGTDDINYVWCDDAIASAQISKSTYKASVYTVGIFEGANPDSDIDTNFTYDTRTEHGQSAAVQLVAANRYMHYTSSNYKDAQSMQNGGTKNSDGYYLSASDANGLNSVFQKISQTAGGSTLKLGSETVLRDVISQCFDLPAGADVNSITAQSYACTGFTSDNKPTWATTPDADKYDVTLSADKKTVEVTGFDYAANYVGKDTTTGQQHNPAKKLVVTIPVQLTDESATGEVPTNGTNSCISGKNGTEDVTFDFPTPTVYVPFFTVAHVESRVNDQGENFGQETGRKDYPLWCYKEFNLTSVVTVNHLYGGTFESDCATVHHDVQGNPMKLNPTENATYYIWEVPNTYLTPRNYNVWRHLPENNGQKTVVRLYPLTAADRTLYKQVGFVIDDKDYVSGCDEFNVTINDTPTLYQTAVAEQNGQHYETLYLDKGAIKASKTAIDESGLVSGQHIDDGCLAGIKLDADGMIKFKTTGVTFRPYWITLDNVKVYGTTARTCTYVAGSESTSVSDDKTSLSCVYMGDTVTTQAMSFAKSFTMADSQPAVDESLTVTVVDGSNTTQVKVAPNGSVRDQVAYQAPAGKVFAGWFADQAYTTPADLDQVTEDTTIYAKYVSDSYLDLAYSRTGLFRLRGVTLISAVDNPANYQASGIMVNGQKIDVSYASRYRIFKTPANLFGAARDAKLMLADKSLSGTGTLEVTPYWITLDGTEVHGITHSLHYNTRTIWE